MSVESWNNELKLRVEKWNCAFIRCQPMVRALSTKRALASWEVMNEPEGSVLIAPHANPCFSTTILTGTGAGWTGEGIPMFNFLRGINRQARRMIVLRVGSFIFHFFLFRQLRLKELTPKLWFRLVHGLNCREPMVFPTLITITKTHAWFKPVENH